MTNFSFRFNNYLGKQFRKVAALLVVVASVLFVVPTQSGAASSSVLSQRVPSTTGMLGGVALDARGDAFSVSYANNAVYVLPSFTGVLFGQKVIKGKMAQLKAASGLDQPAGIAIDTHGDLFISNAGFADSISVVAKTSRTLFGQSFRANRTTTLNAAHGIITPMGLAFGQAGELYVASESLGDIAVVPAITGTYFGQSATANQTTFLTATSGLNNPIGLALDPRGNLFATTIDGVSVLPDASGSIYGNTVTANTLGTISQMATNGQYQLAGIAIDSYSDFFYAIPGEPVIGAITGPGSGPFSGGLNPDQGFPLTFGLNSNGALGVAVDGSGNIFITNFDRFAVVPINTGTIDGSAVTQETLFTFPAGVSFHTGVGSWNDSVVVDSAGNAFFTSNDGGQTFVFARHSGVIFGQHVRAGVPTLLSASSSISSPYSLAIDKKGDLFFGDLGSSNVSVLARTSKTVFGQSVQANVLTSLSAVTGSQPVSAMAFDARGDLVYMGSSNNSLVYVLPASSGTFFGQSVTANTEVAISAMGNLMPASSSLQFDSHGNLYFLGTLNDRNIVEVLAPHSTKMFGQRIPALSPTRLNLLSAFKTAIFEPVSISLDTRGDLFVTGTAIGQGGSSGAIYVAPAASGQVFGAPVVANHISLIPGGMQSSVFYASYWANGSLWAIDNGGLFSIR